MFLTAFGWVLLASSMAVLGLLFLLLVNNFYSDIQVKFAGSDVAPGVSDAVVAPFLLWAGVIGMLVIPLLAVRSVTEEFQTGAYRLLTSAPLSTTQIVFGKFIAIVSLSLIYILLLALFPFALWLLTPIDIGKTGAALLGVFLLITSFGAAALFFAYLTRTPTLAIVVALGFLLLLFILFSSGSSHASVSTLFIYVSNFSHFLTLLSGVIHSADIAYFILFAILFITLTIIYARQRMY